MEEPLETRYVFMMMLSQSNLDGSVDGTDSSIARLFNMPLADFQRAVKPLLEPDPRSNSPTDDGKRVERIGTCQGYRVINYRAYSQIRDEKHRQVYNKAVQILRAQREREGLPTKGTTADPRFVELVAREFRNFDGTFTPLSELTDEQIEGAEAAQQVIMREERDKARRAAKRKQEKP